LFEILIMKGENRLCRKLRKRLWVGRCSVSSVREVFRERFWSSEDGNNLDKIIFIDRYFSLRLAQFFYFYPDYPILSSPWETSHLKDWYIWGQLPYSTKLGLWNVWRDSFLSSETKQNSLRDINTSKKAKLSPKKLFDVCFSNGTNFIYY